MPLSVFSDRVKDAAQFSETAHKGQMYGDRPFFPDHIEKVVNRVYYLGGDDDELITAYCHDGVEDQKMTVGQIADKFGLEILVNVLAITHMVGESYTDYIKRVRLNPKAKRVKLADLSCNLEESEKEKNVKRMMKYRDALEILNEEICK